MASSAAQAVDKDEQEHAHHHWCNDDVVLKPLEEVSFVTASAAECAFKKEQVLWPHNVNEPRRVKNKFEGAKWKRAPSGLANIDILQDAHAELNRLTVIHEGAHFPRLCAAERAELHAARMGAPPRGSMPPARALSITILMPNVSNPSSVTDLLDAAAYLAATPGGTKKRSASHDARMSFLAGGNAGKYLSGIKATRQHLGNLEENTHADVYIAWAVRPETALANDREAKPIEARLYAIPYKATAFEYAETLLGIIRLVLREAPNAPSSRLLESYGDMNYDNSHDLNRSPGEDVECAYERSVIRTANRFFELLYINEKPLWAEKTQQFIADGYKMDFTKMWARMVPQPKEEEQKAELCSRKVSFAALIHHKGSEAHEAYPGERACDLIASMKKQQQKRDGEIFGLMPPKGEDHNVGLHAFWVERVSADIGEELSDYGLKSAPGLWFRWNNTKDTIVDRLVFRIVPIDDRLFTKYMLFPVTHRNVRGMHEAHRNAIFEAFENALYGYLDYFQEVENPNSRKRKYLESSDMPCTPGRFEFVGKRQRVDWEKEHETARLMAVPFRNPGQRLGDVFSQLKNAGADALCSMIAAMAAGTDHEATLLEGVRCATHWMTSGPTAKRMLDQINNGEAPKEPAAAAPAPETPSEPPPAPAPKPPKPPKPPPAPPGPLPTPAEIYEFSSPALDRLMRDSMRIDDSLREEALFEVSFPDRKRKTITSEKEDPTEAAAEIAVREAEYDAERRDILAEAKQALVPVEALLKNAFDVQGDFLTDEMMSELHQLGNSTTKMVHLLRAIRGKTDIVRNCSLIVCRPVSQRPKVATSFYNIPRTGAIKAERIDQVLNRCHESKSTPGLRILLWRQEPERMLFHLPRKSPVEDR